MLLFRPMLATLLCIPLAAGAAEALPNGCEPAASRTSSHVRSEELPFPGVQLAIRTPVAPPVLASGARKYLIYELHLQNHAVQALNLNAIEISADGTTVARLEQEALEAVLRHVGAEQAADPRRLEGGRAAVAFLCLAFEQSATLPRALRHHVMTNAARVDGPLVVVDRAPLPLLGRPLTGADWHPQNGPHLGSHHRSGLLVEEGVASISRRYAIDWRKMRNGALFEGDARDVRSYHTYGQNVLAVADAVVVAVRDGYPDNIPRTEAGFETAVPVTRDSIAGNMVLLDLGNGRFASYSHLQPGSVQAKAGQRVKRGQVLGRIGNSGDSRWPHLHFQLTSVPSVLAGEGLPFRLDRYRLKLADGSWQLRRADFPWGNAQVIDFGPAQPN
ncbi:MAG: M23 family metallopeptidase [Pseudomonadota bacterium]